MNILGKVPYLAASPQKQRGMPKKGDSIVVRSSDGSTGLFLLEVDHRHLVERHAKGEVLTDEEKGQIVAAHKAFALFAAGSNEVMMDALTEMVNSPDFQEGLDLSAIN